MEKLGLLFLALAVGCSGHNSGNGSSSNGGGGGDMSVSGGGLDMTADCVLTDTCSNNPDGGMVCGLNSCMAQGAACGPIGDGCGGVIQCGSCPQGQACGAGGTNFQCATVPGCNAATCTSAGANCGQIGDGCGGLTTNCGMCMSPDICGGSGVASVCSSPMPMGNADLGVPCGRFCGMFANCDMNTTTISGTVLAGTDHTLGYGNPDPIYNAVVYIPTTTPQVFGTQVSCDKCGTEITGDPLDSFTTGIDGKFTLSHVPCGTGINLPLVIQLGRWRRQIVIPDVACCANTALSEDDTHLPRTHVQGDIPHIAVSTGNVDALECVLLKMGIASTEFGKPSDMRRVDIYRGNGAHSGKNTPNEGTLVGSTATLDNYDMVLFPCWGGQNNKDLTSQQNLISFGDKGGRVFATHFSYTWLATVGTVGTPMDGAPTGTPPEPQPWVGTATWNVNENDYNDTSETGIIDQSFPKGTALAQWLAQPAVNASTTAGQIPIQYVRQDLDAIVPPSQRWLSTTVPDAVPVVHYTFNTPVGVPANQQCGRVVFSDFHVENARTGGDNFPDECGNASPMTPQEKLLEFMLFDLAGCVAPDSQPPGCNPRSCMDLNAQCGPQADGCGNIIQCGDCPPGQACGAGGPNQCGNVPCTPVTCMQVGANCGVIGDGCNGTVDCGPCTAPDTCGGGGVANQCGGSIVK